jgi:magnesium chelatase subunit I
MDSKSRARTVGELKRAGWRPRSVRDEVRENLSRRLREGTPLFPGLHGYQDTVVRDLVHALLSRHDILLLGLRGQGKTRLLRQIPTLLDEWMPALPTPLRDDPLRPVSSQGRRLLEEHGDETELVWIHRDDRYREKLATPDVTMADIVGDIDPVKAVSQGLGFSHEDALHWGLVPRSNRGIFALNELPDLQPRIQVGLLNLLEERDVQIRGVPVRLELDVLFLFSANPEDYTQRGNLITPLKDRIGSQILTHYPSDTAVSRTITDQEAWIDRGLPVHVPEPLREVLEQVAFEARAMTELVDPRSGVSQRLSITALEVAVGAAEARALRSGAEQVRVRLSDIFAATPAVCGKLELLSEGEGPKPAALALVGKACQSVFDATFRNPYDKRRKDPTENPDFPVVSWFESGNRLELDADAADVEHGKTLSSLPGLDAVMEALARNTSWNPGEDRDAWRELFLEGLHQHGRISRELRQGALRFGDLISGIMR